ncbi:hypothetical protein DXX93_15465 [Thalassotalea euphylliae]|uniref:Uncharacterized protein n=1 Tax=Thalassotalea euphylliae TaxID=1655234 RepID=A0A3E0TTF3_9GAMM|nr:hypothetical protein [Thalassotalea euphylliae]REL27818.1 hypothetical protein DXX93_15465 [Thalassotalea euphylliae]
MYSQRLARKPHLTAINYELNSFAVLIKKLTVFAVTLALGGCASGQLDLYNADGKKVGECTAGYDWHPYGAKDSVDWLLNWCAQQAIAEGMEVARVSDPAILQKDYSYPKPTAAPYWTKKSSKAAFRANIITETEYGYILADIENEFYLRNVDALNQLEQGEISEDDYRQLLEKSALIFYGD